MQTVEVIGFLMFTIVIAGIITTFIFQFDFRNFSEVISSFFISKDDFKSVEEVDVYELVGKLSSCWQKCSFGLTDATCGAVLVKKSSDVETLTTSSLNAAITKLNYCSNCEIEFSGEKALPAVVSFQCKNGKLKIN